MRRNTLLLLLVLMVGTVLSGNADVSAICQAVPDNGQKASNSPAISETDTYLDLKTGKTFRMIYDGLNEKYNREDLFELELYVNTRTRDTFWLEQALLVNNALRRDDAGSFRVDPRKVKRDGDRYKVVNNKVDIKANDDKKADRQKDDSVRSF